MNNKNINEPLTSIIILNYNAGQLLFDCIESLLKTKYQNYEIIIVDNASNDKSYKKCEEKYPQIEIIENEENLGYCEGNNIGIRKAKGEFIVILNPDTLVEPEWLSELFVAYEENGEGLYQPKFLTTTDHSILMSTGNMIQIFGFGYSRGKGEKDSKKFDKIEVIGYASGTCLFTSTKILKKLDMLDSFLFAYHDDLDLGWRAALQGIKSYYVPKSLVYHPPEGFSFKWSSYKFYLLERNRQYCILTHYSRRTLFKMIPALILVEITMILFYLMKKMLILKIKASFDIIKNFRHIMKRYSQIQKERKISDKEIMKNFSDELIVPREVSSNKKNILFNSLISKISKITRLVI